MTKTKVLFEKPIGREPSKMPIQKSLFSTTSKDQDAHDAAKKILGRQRIDLVYVKDPEQAATAITTLMQEDSHVNTKNHHFEPTKKRS